MSDASPRAARDRRARSSATSTPTASWSPSSRRSADDRRQRRASPAAEEQVAAGARRFLQSFDPPGVACRNLQESLLRQLERAASRAIPRCRPDRARALGPLPAPPVPGARQGARRRRCAELEPAVEHHPRARDPSRPQVLDRARPHYVEPDVDGASRSATSTSSSSTTTACRGCGSRRAYRRMLQKMRAEERPDRGAAVHQGQDALGDLADQEPRPAPAHDLQGRRVDRPPAARVPRPRHRPPAADGPARRGRGHRHARVDGQPGGLQQVHPHAARPLPDEVLLPQRHRPRVRRRHLVAHGEAQDPAADPGRGRRAVRSPTAS